MILLALGSNVGAREKLLRDAQVALEELGIYVEHESSVMTTPALLPEGAPPEWDMPFLNQVLRVQTALSPEAVLDAIKRTEQLLGRQDRGRWGPREIDIDLLAYGDVVMDTPRLVLPHPGIATRDFVLKPLMEIAPTWRHPVTGLTAAEMLA